MWLPNTQKSWGSSQVLQKPGSGSGVYDHDCITNFSLSKLTWDSVWEFKTLENFKNGQKWGWRRGSAVRSTCCFRRRKFNCHHPHSDLTAICNSSSSYPTFSLASSSTAHTWWTDIYSDKALRHKIKLNLRIKGMEKTRDNSQTSFSLLSTTHRYPSLMW